VKTDLASENRLTLKINLYSGFCICSAKQLLQIDLLRKQLLIMKSDHLLMQPVRAFKSALSPPCSSIGNCDVEVLYPSGVNCMEGIGGATSALPATHTIQAIVRSTDMPVPWDDTRPLALQSLSLAKPITVDRLETQGDNRSTRRYQHSLRVVFTEFSRFYVVRFVENRLWLTELNPECVGRAWLNASRSEEEFQTVGFTAQIVCQSGTAQPTLALCLMPQLSEPVFGQCDQARLNQLAQATALSQICNEPSRPSRYRMRVKEAGWQLQPVKRNSQRVKPWANVRQSHRSAASPHRHAPGSFASLTSSSDVTNASVDFKGTNLWELENCHA
jgi:hypothetical protein